MQKVNSITICRDNYKSQEEFEGAIFTTVMLLINAEYIVTVKYDEKGLGIVLICFDYKDEMYGGLLPYWLTPEQAEQVDWENN